MKAYGEVEVYFHPFLTSHSVEVNGHLYTLAAVPRGKSIRVPTEWEDMWAPEPISTL
jgi:hypothetical protein